MSTSALFDDETCEVITYKFLEPQSKSERVDLFFLGSVPDNIRESADKGIKETYILLSSKYKTLPRKISIWFRGFSKAISGNSAELAFSIAFIECLIKQKYLHSSLTDFEIYATGIINSNCDITAINGIKDKFLGIISKIATENSNCNKIIFYPSLNNEEVQRFIKEDPFISSSLSNVKLMPVDTLLDVIKIFKLKNRLSLKGKLKSLIPIVLITLTVTTAFFIGNSIENKYIINKSLSFLKPLPKMDFTSKTSRGYMMLASDVFAGPSKTDYAKLGSVSKSENIIVLARCKDWYFIEYSTPDGNKRGYVSSNIVSLFTSAFEIENFTGKEAKSIGEIGIRSGPSDKYANIGTIFANETILVLFSEDDKYFIEYNTKYGKKRGYIAKVLVSFD